MKKSLTGFNLTTAKTLDNLQNVLAGAYTVSQCTCCESSGGPNSHDCKDGDIGDSEKSKLYSIDIDIEYVESMGHFHF